VKPYLMESEEEARRLVAQAQSNPVSAHLVATGLSAGHHALDAGCGPGVITEAMALQGGPSGSVVGMDLSPERLSEARARCEPLANCRFVRANVCSTGLPDASFDYVWSQFLFEYLPQPQVALAELLRVTRPGGRVVVADVDGVGLFNWPFPPEIEQGFHTLVRAVASATGFDIHVGRKMFHLFRRAGLQDVRVHLAPLWVVAGAAEARLVEDWAIRLQTLEAVAAPAFGGVTPYRAFSQAYLALLSDADTLKYSVLLVTEGKKP
jgi:SAM-dependent methyltransferase